MKAKGERRKGGKGDVVMERVPRVRKAIRWRPAGTVREAVQGRPGANMGRAYSVSWWEGGIVKVRGDLSGKRYREIQGQRNQADRQYSAGQGRTTREAVQ